MRVALVGRYPLSPGKIVGGVQSVTSTLASALSSQPEVDRVYVLTFHSGRFQEGWRSINNKLRVCYLRGQTRLTLPTFAILKVLRARQVIGELEPDVVHGQGIGSTPFTATRVDRPCVITVHGLAHVEAKLAALGVARVALMELMVRSILARAQVVISTSDYDARALEGMVKGIRISIPNPVAPEFFVDPIWNDAPPSLLYAGVVLERKNLTGLIHAFAGVKSRIPDARLVLVGPVFDQAYAAKLPPLVASLGLGEAVDLRGFVENAELIQLLRQCTALVLFSNEETSPTIIAQAMSVGKPVVASDVGGISEMIQDGTNGYLVASGDERAMTDRMIEVLSQPGLQRKMGQRSQEIARVRYEPQEVARRTLTAYRKAIVEYKRA